MEIETTWEGWKKLFQVIVKNDSAPNDHFVNGFAFIPSSPSNVAPQKGIISTHFAQNSTEFGGGGGLPLLLISVDRS